MIAQRRNDPDLMARARLEANTANRILDLLAGTKDLPTSVAAGACLKTAALLAKTCWPSRFEAFSRQALDAILKDLAAIDKGGN